MHTANDATDEIARSDCRLVMRYRPRRMPTKTTDLITKRGSDQNLVSRRCVPLGGRRSTFPAAAQEPGWRGDRRQGRVLKAVLDTVCRYEWLRPVKKPITFIRAGRGGGELTGLVATG